MLGSETRRLLWSPLITGFHGLSTIDRVRLRSLVGLTKDNYLELLPIRGYSTTPEVGMLRWMDACDRFLGCWITANWSINIMMILRSNSWFHHCNAKCASTPTEYPSPTSRYLNVEIETTLFMTWLFVLLKPSVFVLLSKIRAPRIPQILFSTRSCALIHKFFHHDFETFDSCLRLGLYKRNLYPNSLYFILTPPPS